MAPSLIASPLFGSRLCLQKVLHIAQELLQCCSAGPLLRSCFSEKSQNCATCSVGLWFCLAKAVFSARQSRHMCWSWRQCSVPETEGGDSDRKIDIKSVFLCLCLCSFFLFLCLLSKDRKHTTTAVTTHLLQWGKNLHQMDSPPRPRNPEGPSPPP